MQKVPTEQSIYYVFIADDNGMQHIFPLLKAKLTEDANHHFTLVYYSLSKNYVFQKELDVLIRHYPSQFQIHCHTTPLDLFGSTGLEILEVIINANTKKSMTFFISDDEFISEIVTHRLQFLGIPKQAIQVIF
jgi:ferredoxin-NADP reductase